MPPGMIGKLQPLRNMDEALEDRQHLYDCGIPVGCILYRAFARNPGYVGPYFVEPERAFGIAAMLNSQEPADSPKYIVQREIK